MGRKRIEKRLKRYAAGCKELAPRGREAKIEALLQEAPTVCTRAGLADFVWEQLGYLGRYCLVWQLLWMALFGWTLQYGVPQWCPEGSQKALLVMTSLLPPLLVLLTVEDITRVYQKSMLEIEYATKYSLQSVVLVRMAALCVFHAVLLTGCIFALHVRLASGVGQLLVYGFTPMLLLTGALLGLMQRWQGEALRNAVVWVYGWMLLLAFIGGTERFGWYDSACFGGWCAACAVGFVFSGWQFVRLGRRLADFERIA